MLAPQTRRIYQLPSFTSPATQLSGAYTVWDVPMGPVAGGYRTMRGTPEDLAAYLELGALLKRLGLPGARALLAGVAPAPTVAGGVLYAIEDSRWNGGPGATVYVHGLDSGQFAPVGYGPVGGKMVLVSVDVVGGKYTELVPPGQIWYYVGDPAQQSISIGELDLASNAFDPNGLNEGNVFYAAQFVEDNLVGPDFSGNLVHGEFRRNNIGGNCSGNTFRGSFTNNKLGLNVNTCYFDVDTRYVDMGDGCERVSLYNCAGTAQQPFVIPAGTTDAEYRNNRLVSAAGGLLTTAQEDAFVDPTFAIAATYLNKALTIRTYSQASVSVTLPALTSADVPALLRIKHQSGIGGTTCLLSVPGLARPLRVGEYALLAATATPGIPANPSTGDPGLPAGTAWVELNASAQQLEPLSYPVMVGTQSLGYVGYPSLATAALGAPYRPIVLNVPYLVISQDMTLSGNLSAVSTVQILIENGVTLTLTTGMRLHNIQFLRLSGSTAKVKIVSTQGQSLALDASQAVQLVDSRIGPDLVFSAAGHVITARGRSVIDNATGQPGTIYLYDTATAGVGAGGPTVVDRRPGAASGAGGTPAASVFSYAARRYEAQPKVQLQTVYHYAIPCTLVLPGSAAAYVSGGSGFVVQQDGFYGLKGHAHMVFPNLSVYAECFFFLNNDGRQIVCFNQITPRDVGGGLILGTEQLSIDVYLPAGTTVHLGYSDSTAGGMYPRNDAPSISSQMSIIRLA